jgi:hypothetical protein
MPSETPDERSRQRIEGADEKRIEERSFPSAVQARFHRKAFLDNPNFTKSAQQLPELTRTVLQQDWSVFMLQRHLHQLRQRIQPRDAVIHLKHGLAAGLQDPPALVDELLRVRRVLHNAVGIYQIERLVGKWKPFSVCFAKIRLQPLLFEILLRQRDCRRREIDARDGRTTAGEPRQIRARAATHLQNLTARIAVEGDETKQVVKFFEMILIEIGEESWCPDRMFGDFQIVDVTIPVFANVAG